MIRRPTIATRTKTLLPYTTLFRSVVMSEYHTICSSSAVFMLQDSTQKYVHYCDHPPELFDLQQDPEELINLADHPDWQEQLALWESRLRTLLNPGEVDQRAKHRQAELIELFGGEEAIRSGQGIGSYTPSPLP